MLLTHSNAVLVTKPTPDKGFTLAVYVLDIWLGIVIYTSAEASQLQRKEIALPWIYKGQ